MSDVKEEKIVVQQELGFDDAIKPPAFVKFEEGEPQLLRLRNIRFERLPEDAKFHAGDVALCAEVFNEAGVTVQQFQTASSRLLKALRPHVEGKDGVVVMVTRVGDKFNTQYSVKLVE